MKLKLYFHPLASFCWKVLIPLYENDTPFEPIIVDLANETQRAALEKLWPVTKFPVLVDETNERSIPESTIIIEYLAQHYPGKVELIPRDPDLAREVRLLDRFYDQYVHQPMQKVVADRLRQPGKNDPHGVDEAKAMLQTAYGMIDREMSTKRWAAGDTF